MTSGPTVAVIFSGVSAIKGARDLIGPTDPLQAAAGTIRGDLSIVPARNLVNASASVAEAEREIALWFKPEDMVTNWVPCSSPWIYDLSGI
jgi:nucleoside-diphosphate kinase